MMELTPEQPVSPLYLEHRHVDAKLRDYLIEGVAIQFLPFEQRRGDGGDGGPHRGQRLASHLLETLDLGANVVVGVASAEMECLLHRAPAVAALDFRERLKAFCIDRPSVPSCARTLTDDGASLIAALSTACPAS